MLGFNDPSGAQTLLVDVKPGRCRRRRRISITDVYQCVYTRSIDVFTFISIRLFFFPPTPSFCTRPFRKNSINLISERVLAN